MMRGLVAFVALWAVITAAIVLWQHLYGFQKWKVVKVMAFGAVTSLLTVVVLTAVVILF